jgi:hypothetical protein
MEMAIEDKCKIKGKKAIALCVIFIVKQDAKIVKRVEYFRAYSFDVCLLFVSVLLSNHTNGCVLIIYPDKTNCNSDLQT